MYNLVLQYIRKMGKRKKEDDPILRKKKKKKNSVTITIAVDGKEIVFPMKLKLEGELFENFKKRCRFD